MINLLAHSCSPRSARKSRRLARNSREHPIQIMKHIVVPDANHADPERMKAHGSRFVVIPLRIMYGSIDFDREPHRRGVKVDHEARNEMPVTEPHAQSPSAELFPEDLLGRRRLMALPSQFGQLRGIHTHTQARG